MSSALVAPDWVLTLDCAAEEEEMSEAVEVADTTAVEDVTLRELDGSSDPIVVLGSRDAVELTEESVLVPLADWLRPRSDPLVAELSDSDAADAGSEATVDDARAVTDDSSDVDFSKHF